MTLDQVVLLLAEVALVWDEHSLALNLVRLGLGSVRLGPVPAAATGPGPPLRDKVRSWDAGAGEGARDPRGLWWSPVQQVKSGDARDSRVTRWSSFEQDEVGGGNARTRTRQHTPFTHCSYLWVRHGRTGPHRDASARAAPEGRGGGRVGTIPTPNTKTPARARIARDVPQRRSCDCLVWPLTIQAEKGAISHNAVPDRALAGTVASGAPIVAVDMA